MEQDVLDTLKKLIDCGYRLTSDMYDIAVDATRLGHLEVLKYFLSKVQIRSSEDRRTIFSQAVRNGRLNILEWLHQQGFPHHNYICYSALTYNQRCVFDWLVEHDYEIDEYCYKFAANRGDIDLLEFIWRKRSQPLPQLVYEGAAESGRLDVFEWALANGCDLSYSRAIFHLAAIYNHRQIITWMLNHGFFWTQYTSNSAIICGHVDLLKWMIKQGCPLDKEDACMLAADNGHFELCKWLHSLDCTLNHHLCEIAIEKKNLLFLQWLFENKCPYRDHLVEVAIDHNALDIVKWLHKNNWDFESICKSVKLFSHLHITHWLFQQGHQEGHNLKSLKPNISFTIHHFNSIKYLLEHHDFFTGTIYAKEWITTIETSLQQVFYDDLCCVIKSFI